MKASDIVISSKHQLDALKECVGLMDDGYIIRFVASIPDGFMVSLRHGFNGRKITLVANSRGWCLKSRGSIIKQVLA